MVLVEASENSITHARVDAWRTEQRGSVANRAVLIAIRVASSGVGRGEAVSDPFDSTQSGWSRYYVKSSPLLQRELSIFDDESFADDPVFAVVGKKRVFEILNASGSVVMTALMKGVTLSKFEYTNAEGTSAGKLKVNSVLSKKYMELALASGGAWTVVRDAGAKQTYAVLEDNVAIVKLDLTTLALQRNYAVDIAESVDLPLALGLVWAINFAHLQRIGAMGAVAAV